MRFKKTHILLLLFSILYSLFPVSNAYSSVYMGGEITWQCLGNGRYKFYMKLYKECGGTPLAYGLVEVMEIINYPSVGQTTKISLGRDSINDDSPVCNAAGPHISCATATLPNLGAVSEYFYSTASLNPDGITLSGVPPAQGWIFTYKSPTVAGVTWKRNQCTNIQNADLLTWGLRAIMYPYKGRNANPCYDNSPTFAEKPSTVICTGYPFTYNPNAWDNELDSLVYDWAQPLDSSLNPITTYFPNYSFQNPLPGPAINPQNVAATINHHTGEISFESFTPGAFVTVSQVSAYKNNILVAQIYREMQVVLLNCGNNTPPAVTPPFINKKTGLPTFVDTVYAGTLVKFNLTGTDDATQTMTMNASGPDFNPASIGSNNPCLNPPCATLTPALPLSGKGSVSTAFNWQTTCDDVIHHVVVGNNPNLVYNHPLEFNVHNFVISTQDDYCPVPGKNVSTITIVVLAQPQLAAPSLRCVSVDNVTGDNTLTWIPLTDTTHSFISYNIYYSLNKAGPYQLLTTIPAMNTTTYTHIGANGNNKPVYYYIRTESTCDSTLSIPGDTLASMYLKLGASTTVAELTWNALRQPPLPTAGEYIVWREHPAGKWSPRDTTNNLSYNNIIALCSAFMNYKITVTDASGCTSVSSFAGKQFQDLTDPATPILDTVSIDSITKKAIITWKVDTSKDTKKYILYEYFNGAWQSVSTIPGFNSTFILFLNDKFNPYSAFEQFCIAAEDSCTNLSPQSIPQNTLFLTITTDICHNAINLSWNPFINMNNIPMDNLAGYKVYVNENNAPGFSLLTTLPANVTSYSHTNLDKNSHYCYYIRAFDNTGNRTSTSNIVCATAKTINIPKFTYLRYATVNLLSPTDEVIELRCHTDTTGLITNYIVLRSDSTNGTFTAIGNIQPTGFADVFYTDNNASPDKQSYSYKIEVIDSCGNVALTSNIGETIFLSASANNNNTNTLTWNPYQQWDGPIKNYNVNRSIGQTFLNNVNSLSFLVSLAPNVPYNTCNDDVSGNLLNDGSFYYQVEAVESPGAQFPFQDKSFSNVAEATQNPRFFIPNAFYPYGITNSVFSPIGMFYNTEGYYFAIFNRLGVKVFESTTPDVGWDGKFNGSPASMGVYVYILKYNDENNKHFTKQGTVTLLR